MNIILAAYKLFNRDTNINYPSYSVLEPPSIKTAQLHSVYRTLADYTGRVTQTMSLP